MPGKRFGFSPAGRRQGIIAWASKEAHPQKEISRQVIYHRVLLGSMPSNGGKTRFGQKEVSADPEGFTEVCMTPQSWGKGSGPLHLPADLSLGAALPGGG